MHPNSNIVYNLDAILKFVKDKGGRNLDQALCPTYVAQSRNCGLHGEMSHPLILRQLLKEHSCKYTNHTLLSNLNQFRFKLDARIEP